MSSIAPFHACLCVKSETAAVLVVTQQGLLNHMQVWEEEVKGEDVLDPDVLKTVEEAITVSTSVKRIKIDWEYLRWTNVATAILKGAAHNTVLRELELTTPRDFSPPQEVVDGVRRANPKLRLVVTPFGESASHATSTLPHMLCVSCPKLCLSGVRWSVGTSVSQ